MVLVATSEAAMALVFRKLPTHSDTEQGTMRWFGEDNDKYVECRVTVTALTRRLGAEGTADAKLAKAFAENREKIEAVAKSKYAAGKVKTQRDSPEQTRTIIYLDVADL